MNYKRLRKNGSSFLVDDVNNVIAISFSNYTTKNKLCKNIAEEKRKHILNYLKTHKENKYFIQLNNGEIYLTQSGENFITECSYAFNKPKVTMKVKTVEKLDDGKSTKNDDYNEYIQRAEKWITDLASMSSHTHQPFSINKCYQNPYDDKQGKRVFVDLYRFVNNIHEGYIVLGKKGTLNAMKSVLIDRGSFAAMRKKYGDSIKLYVVAQSFDTKAIEYVKLNLFNVECITLLKMAESLVLEAREYYEEADASFKMKDWGKRYESVFGCSLKTDKSTPIFAANSSNSSSSRTSASISSNILAFSSKTS